MVNQARIAEVVRKVEERTSAEVVPMIVGRSDPYPGVAGRGAMIGLFVALAGWIFLQPTHDVSWLATVLPLAALMGWVGASVPAAVRFLAGEATLAREVHQRAVQAFHELDLSSTQGRTGVLVMFSVLERRVEVIADRGIAPQVEAGAWSGVVSDAIAKIRTHGLEAGVVQAVEEVGAILARHAPRAPGDRNEIPNRVVICSE